MNQKSLVIYLIFVFLILFQISYLTNVASLSDDTVHLWALGEKLEKSWSVSAIYSYFTSDPNTFSRPCNALLSATIMLFTCEEWHLFFWSGLLYIICFYLLYVLIKTYSISVEIAALIIFVAIIYPLSSSTQFSNILSVANVPIALFLGSWILVLKGSKIYSIVAGILLTISFLIYEINLFMIPILGFVIYKMNDSKLEKMFHYLFVVAFPLALTFLYKKLIAAALFEHYYAYTDNKTKISIQNSLEAVISILKTNTLDVFYILKRSVISTSYFSIYDWLLVIFGITLSLYILKKIKEQEINIQKKYLLYSVLIFMLSNGIYFISVYKANAYGFENRLAGWSRISFAILFCVSILYVIYKTTKHKIRSFYFAVLLLWMSLGVITIIAQKNAWQYAGNVNKEIILNIQYSNKSESVPILIVHNKSLDNHFICDEPTIKSDYELESLSDYYTKRTYIGQNVVLKSYSWDRFFGKNLNNRKPNFVQIPNGIKIKKTIYQFPFYIYDVNEKKMMLLSSTSDFNQLLSSRDQ